MNIETLKENLCLNQIVSQSKESLVVEGDVIIPDIKPDILSAINTSGNVCIYKKEILDSKVKIEGGVQVYLMYLADDEKSSVRGVNTVLDFSSFIKMENVNSSMNLETCVNIKEIECKVLNGRKVNVKAFLEAKITVFKNNSVEFVRQIANDETIQVLSADNCIDAFIGRGSTKVYAKDTISIDEQDGFVEVLKNSYTISNKEIKTSYNKILIKADLKVNICYLTENGKISEIEKVIPIMGFIDMQDISDDDICNISFETRNIMVKPNSQEEHSIYVEIEIDVYCNAYEKKNLEIIQDLYSPSENLRINQKMITLQNENNEVKDELNINETIEIPDLKDGKVYSVEVFPKINNEYINGEKVVYEGELVFTFIYFSDSSNRVETKEFKTAINRAVFINGLTTDCYLNSSIEVLGKKMQINSNGKIDINVDMQIVCDCTKMSNINVIDSIETDDNGDNSIYSMVVYFVKPGDTIWNIAKKFKSTIKAISVVNGIDDESSINAGQQLFIPKFV